MSDYDYDIDDGWCYLCQETTDHRCIHLDDGTTIPFPEKEIKRLSAEVERQASVIEAALENGLFLVRMLEVGLTEEEFTVGDLAKVQSSFEFFRALEAWLEE